MGFTVIPRGTAIPGPSAGPSAPRLAPLAHAWKAETAPGCYEVVKAVTADGWMFERMQDGTWATGHLPTRTVVRERLRDLRTCRAYVASGKAREDLDRILAEGKGAA